MTGIMFNSLFIKLIFDYKYKQNQQETLDDFLIPLKFPFLQLDNLTATDFII